MLIIVWYHLWLVTTAAADGWRLAMITRRIRVAQHHVLAEVGAITDSYKAFLRELQKIEELALDTLDDVQLPTAQRLTIEVAQERMERAAQEFLAGWRKHSNEVTPVADGKRAA
jgi:hypothetical protein